MRKYIFIAVSLLAILSCVKESVAPEQRITGIFALDDGSGLSDEYIEFKNGYLTTYSLRPKQKTFAEGKFWNASENDFYLDVAWRYSIIEDNLKADGKSRGKISISEDALKIGESTYTRLKGFESDYYSVIKPERTSAEVSYQAGTGQFSFSIENPVEGDALSAQCESDWVHDLSVDGDNVSFSYEENNTSAARTAVITCSCYGAKAVSFTLAQSGMPVTNLTLNKTSLAMNVGTSETLVATVTPPGATLLWSSTNTTIATVDGNGKVTANANGTATITVKTTDGSKTANCSVTVTTAVTGVSLNKTTLSLIVGSSETLVATVAPSTASNKEVTWSSSNTSVATVDGNGKVTANANGTATITVKTTDGSKTATCAISVKVDAFKNYMFNYNAKEFNSRTHTIPKKTGQSFNVDIVMSANPTIYSDHLHFSGSSSTSFGYMFPNSASNPFNRTDANCEFTFIWKSSTDNGERMVCNRSGRVSMWYDYNWWLQGKNDFQNFNDYVGVQRTSPAISSFVVNYQNIGLQKDYTNNLTSGPKSVTWDNQNKLPDGIAFFRGYANRTGELWTGDFYWMYCATRTLSDIEIQQVIDYNENL